MDSTHAFAVFLIYLILGLLPIGLILVCCYLLRARRQSNTTRSGATPNSAEGGWIMQPVSGNISRTTEDSPPPYRPLRPLRTRDIISQNQQSLETPPPQYDSCQQNVNGFVFEITDPANSQNPIERSNSHATTK